MGPQIGDVAPNFTLRDHHGVSVGLSSYLGSKHVVLVYFPYAFSRVCTGELHALRDQLPVFVNDSTQLLAISCDPMFTLRAFADRDSLGFPLLSDFWPHGAVSQAYGVFDRDRGCAVRGTFILDRSGVLRWNVRHEMPHARSIEEYKAALADL